MLNQLWAVLIFTATATAFLRATVFGEPVIISQMADSLFISAKTGFELAFGLTASLALWLGLFRVAEAAGLINVVARTLAPILHRLMPDVPRDHPAMACIGMNVAMSMLGVDNAALPVGLKAMNELEELNKTPGAATRAQQMFLVYMTTSITVFPASILAYRIQMGAANPTDVFVPLLLASYCGLFAGLAYMAIVQRLHLLDTVLLSAAGILVLGLGSITWFVGHLPPSQLIATATLWGNAILMLTVTGIILAGWVRKIPVFDVFVEGARQGFGMAVELIPYLVAMLLAIGLMRASGAFDWLQSALKIVFAFMNMDVRWVVELPHALMKPFSGGGARAFMLDAFQTNGPDSFVGHLSSLIQGATDTTFYILAVCAGAARLRSLGKAVTGAIIANTVSLVVAVQLAYLFFG